MLLAIFCSSFPRRYAPKPFLYYIECVDSWVKELEAVSITTRRTISLYVRPLAHSARDCVLKRGGGADDRGAVGMRLRGCGSWIRNESVLSDFTRNRHRND